jgi:hypothetical protein
MEAYGPAFVTADLEKMRVIFRFIRVDFNAMQRQFRTLLVATVVATIPASAFASGSVPATNAPSRDSFSPTNLRANQTSTTSTTADPDSQVSIAEEPYHLGKALFSGKYKLGNPKLTTANVAEKKQRLVSLQRTLPAAERGKLNPAEHSTRLTNHEMNALEYYVGMRFGKFITKSPSWVKTDPPPKVALAR